VRNSSLVTIIGIAASVLFTNSIGLHAQAKSGRGELTVTATIVASVGLQFGPDGSPTLIVANAPDPKDNISQLLPSTTDQSKKPAKKADHHK
jgi:hypothetical protein